MKKRDWFTVENWIEELACIGEELDALAALKNWLLSANGEAVLDLDDWRRDWSNVDSHLAWWCRRAEIEDLLLLRCLEDDDAAF